MTATHSITAAYSATGAAWQRGPGRIYDRLAEVVVDEVPVPLAGALALDLGAGTGAASRVLAAAGARVVAADVAAGMLAAGRDARPPAVVADAVALPFPDGRFDAVVAAFSLNHLTDPAVGLREAARVTCPGGAVVASSYAEDDDHPVKAAVEEAATEFGWTAPGWYRDLRRAAMPKLARPDLVAAAARAAGLDGAVVTHRRVDFDDLPAAAMVGWRLGMAQLAPWMGSLDGETAAAVERRAFELLGADPPPLRRSILVVAAASPGSRRGPAGPRAVLGANRLNPRDDCFQDF